MPCNTPVVTTVFFCRQTAMPAKKAEPKSKAGARARPARPGAVAPLEIDPRVAGGFTTCHVLGSTNAAITMRDTSPQCTGVYISSRSEGFRMIVYANYGPGCKPGKDGSAKLLLGDDGGVMLDLVPSTSNVTALQKRLVASTVLPVVEHALRPSPLHAHLSSHLGDGFKAFAERAARSVKKELAGGILKRFAP